MCSIFKIQIDPVIFIKETWKALSGPIGHLRDPERLITQLTNVKNRLEAQSEDHKIEISKAEHVSEGPTNTAKQWLKEVKDFIDQISKILDDHKKGSFRWNINRRAENILADIEKFRENFKLDAITTTLLPKRVVEVFGEQPVVTVDTYLSDIEIALKKDTSQIIGIWGMGGVGKSMVLRSFNNKLLDLSQHNFNYVIYVVVSRDYNLRKLQDDIADRLHLQLNEDKAKQVNNIRDFLANKSFLLLLDDLWNPINFAELGIPLPSCSGAINKKVVFTTRSEELCAKMNVDTKIKIECLNKEQAWQLFEKKVTKETLDADAGISLLAQQVAHECDGLPLALVLIGSAMRTKKTSTEWQDAINHLEKLKPHEIHGMDFKIFSILKFSYDYLANDTLRQCFLLCSLWPEDYSIYKTDLIECWMGNDLVDERKFDTINEAYHKGYSLIGGLEAACLLEKGYDKEETVKMHDMVRYLALSIASNFGEKPNEFIALSTDTSLLLPANCSKLKTLIVQRNKCYVIPAEPGFFRGIDALTYLNLSNSNSIENWLEEICELRNLQYLNLSYTLINCLPSKLSNLQNLRFLILRGLPKFRMPHGVIENLKMLSVIDMTNTFCDNWQEILKLTCNLKGLGIVLKSIADLKLLAKLSNVQTWQLELANLPDLNEQVQLFSISLLGSPTIRSSINMLQIRSSTSLKVVSMNVGDDIQKWCLPRLNELRLKALPNLQNIIWQNVRPAKMLPSLTDLQIFGCHKFSNISWVIQLPSLKYLTVYGCRNLQQIIEDNYSEFEENGVRTISPTFPSLRRLELMKLESLRDFGGSYIFPSLESLLVLDCPMKKLPFGVETARMKLKMITGRKAWWEELNMEFNMRATLQPNFREYKI